MDYKQKYLKYKNKYIKLKQIGGFGSEDAKAGINHNSTQEEKDDNTCSICFDDKPLKHKLNCSHRVCSTCSFQVDKCPLCRSHIVHRFQLNDDRNRWIKI